MINEPNPDHDLASDDLLIRSLVQLRAVDQASHFAGLRMSKRFDQAQERMRTDPAEAARIATLATGVDEGADGEETMATPPARDALERVCSSILQSPRTVALLVRHGYPLGLAQTMCLLQQRWEQAETPDARVTEWNHTDGGSERPRTRGERRQLRRLLRREERAARLAGRHGDPEPSFSTRAPAVFDSVAARYAEEAARLIKRFFVNNASTILLAQQQSCEALPYEAHYDPGLRDSERRRRCSSDRARHEQAILEAQHNVQLAAKRLQVELLEVQARWRGRDAELRQIFASNYPYTEHLGRLVWPVLGVDRVGDDELRWISQDSTSAGNRDQPDH